MSDYDIGEAFAKIEDELIASMMRNIDRHRAEETKEGYEWSMWQTEQLQALEKYKKENARKYPGKFKDINDRISALISIAHDEGRMKQEEAILKAIRNGFRGTKKRGKGIDGEFFRLSERKLEALINATMNDMQNAETAILRMANDKYRSTIFNAQVYYNTGAGTFEKAVDMATKDMLAAGLNCVQYKNGARHRLEDYAGMALRTASTRAKLYGEGEMRQEWGVHTVIMNKRANPCPKCLPFVGKVMIDDVWSGGKASDGPYPLMSSAIAAGLYHPNCKDMHTTFFPGISDAPDDTWTPAELEDVQMFNETEARQQYAERQEEKFGRLAKYSLDPENKKRYEVRRQQWKNVRFKTGGIDAREYADAKRPLVNFRAVPQEKVVDILRTESEEWIHGLSEKEKHAIKKYTYNSGDKKPNRFFERLNAMLRGDLPEDKKLREYADVISGALKKSKLPHDLLCYRNMEFNPYNDYEVGKIFVEEQFVSTSVTESAALNKPFKMVFLVPKGAKGAYIESMSKYPEQREFLLDKKCNLRIVSKQKDNIMVEVIP